MFDMKVTISNKAQSMPTSYFSFIGTFRRHLYVDHATNNETNALLKTEVG